jgi:flavin reductase (DIM6/NTAB) family NADH-FMN oxidoreductase RutF
MNDMLSAVDDGVLRRAFACFPTGVTAVCALVDGQPVGMAASSFTSVSLDPPLVSVCVQNRSSTWRKLSPVSRLGVSVLSAGHENASRQLSAKTGDRFSGIDWQASTDGAIFIGGACVWLESAHSRRRS